MRSLPGAGSEFSANRRNRAAAVPHTPFEVVLHGTDALVLQLVDPARPLRTLLDESRILEQAEVTGHGRPADGECGGDLVDRHVGVAQQVQDLAPPRIPQGLERIAGRRRVPVGSGIASRTPMPDLRCGYAAAGRPIGSEQSRYRNKYRY